MEDGGNTRRERIIGALEAEVEEEEEKRACVEIRAAMAVYGAIASTEWPPLLASAQMCFRGRRGVGRGDGSDDAQCYLSISNPRLPSSDTTLRLMAAVPSPPSFVLCEAVPLMWFRTKHTNAK